MLSGTDMKLENYFSNIYVPEMKNKKKGSLILVTTQIWFNLKCLAQCICSKSNSLTFLDNVWFGMFERFYYLGAKLSPLYLGAKLSGAKLSYNQNQVPYFSFQTYTSPK